VATRLESRYRVMLPGGAKQITGPRKGARNPATRWQARGKTGSRPGHESPIQATCGEARCSKSQGEGNLPA